jgi:endonuclease/exonuclease/phosphatase (EEP) superfamily protein YafD
MPKLLSDRGPEHQPILWSKPKADAARLMRVLATTLAIVVLIAPLTIATAALSGIGHRWPDILAQFTAPALVATAAFTLLLGLFRLKAASAAGLLVVGVLLVAVWPQWAADRGKALSSAPILTLYSANLYFENSDLPTIRASIAEARPDVIVLVEASRDVVFGLDAILADYPHRLVSPDLLRGGTNATVIASRYPVMEKPQRVRDFSYAVAVVDSPLGPINVVGAHLTRPWPYQVQWEQIRQASALAKLTSGLPGPTIVAGDFNSTSSGRIGRQIQTEAGLKPNPGWPGTWPAQIPAFLGFTIDQVYRTPDLAVVSRRVGLRTGSDHRPVVTRFTRAEPRPAP